jgi:hypothetical protein
MCSLCPRSPVNYVPGPYTFPTLSLSEMSVIFEWEAFKVEAAWLTRSAQGREGGLAPAEAVHSTISS